MNNIDKYQPRDVVSAICVPCTGGNLAEAESCIEPRCAISKFRQNILKSFTTTIYQECKSCYGGSVQSAATCDNEHCHLYKFNRKLFKK